MPAALTTMAQGVGTLTLALRGMKDAVEGDEEAIAKLSPQARNFAGIVRGTLIPALDGLSRIASARIFGPLLDEIQPLMRTYLPLLQKVVGDTASVIGRFGEQLAQQFRDPAWSKAFAELGETNVRVIRNLADASLAALPGIRGLTLAFAPMVEWASKLAVSFGQWLTRVVEANQANGDLARTVDRARDTLSQLGRILGNVAEGFWEIGKAAAPLGRDILRDLERVTAEFASWTKSLEGQRTLRAYFDDAKPALYEVAGLMKDVGAAFFRISTDEGFTDLVRMLRTDLLPLLEQVVRQTSAAFGPALIQMLESVGRLFLSIAGSSGPLVSFVEGMTRIAKGLTAIIEKVPGMQQLVVTLAGTAGVLKAISFTSAIFGARTLAASLGLIGPAAARSAAATTAANAAIAASTAATARQAGLARLAFGGWPLAIATAVALSLPELEKLRLKIQSLFEPGSKLSQIFGMEPVDKTPFEEEYERRTGRPAPGRAVAPSAGATRAPDNRGRTRGPGAIAASNARIAASGSVTGDIQGLDASLLERLQAMSAKTGRAISVTSGFRTAGEQASLVASKGLYNPKTNPTGAAPVGSSNHETGMAADISPGREVFGGSAAAYGLAFPVPGEPWHVELAGVSSTLVPAPVGGGSVDGSSVRAAGPVPPSKQEISAVASPIRAAIRGITGGLDEDIPEVRQKVLPKLQALMKDIADGVNTDEALARIKEAGERLRKALENLIDADALRDKLPALRKTIQQAFGGEDEAALMKRFASVSALFRKFFKDGIITDSELATLEKRMDQFKASLSRALEIDQIRDNLDTATSKLRELFAKGFIDEVTFVKSEQQLKKIGQMVREALKDGFVSEAERDKIRAAWQAVNQTLQQGIDDMDEARLQLQLLGREFRKLWADGIISADDAAKIRSSAGQIKGAVAEAIAGAAQAVEDGYARFDSAMADFRSQVEQAFRDQVIGKFQLTIDFASAYEQMATNKATLVEALASYSRAIAGSLDTDAQAVQTAIQRVRAANDEYTAAIISQDRERIKRAIDEKIAANAALVALQEQGLSEQAKAILAAGQQVINAEKTIGAEQVAEQKRIWEETKTAALVGVLEVVDKVAAKLRDGKITWAQAVSEIGTALTNAGMDATTAADLLGQNVAGSMGKAAIAIETAVDKLTAAIDRLVRSLGGAVGEAKGKYDELVGWERALAIRSDALNQKYGLGEYAAQPSALTSPASGASTVTTTPTAPMPAPTPAGPPAAVFTPSRPDENPIAGGRVQYFARGGVAWRRILAHVGEDMPEAMIPLPDHMDPRLRRFLIGLAQGGWRARTSHPGGRQHQPALMARTAEADPGPAPAAGGAGGGGTVIHAPVRVEVNHSGILTHEHDLAETIATVATEKIRDHLIRIGDHNPDIFGGNA